MFRIDGPGNDAGHFVDEDPLNEIPGTQVTAEWLEAVQEEIAAVILDANLSLNKSNNGQLLSALKKMRGSLAGLVGYNTNIMLGADDVGKLIYMNGTSNLTATLPSPGSVKNGARIQILNLIDSAYSCTVTTASGFINTNGQSASVRAISTCASISFISDGVNTWFEDGTSIGLGDNSLVNVLPSRAFNTVYRNTSGKSKFVHIRAISTTSTASSIGLNIGGITMQSTTVNATGAGSQLFGVVKNGEEYSLGLGGGAMILSEWLEG